MLQWQGEEGCPFYRIWPPERNRPHTLTQITPCLDSLLDFLITLWLRSTIILVVRQPKLFFGLTLHRLFKFFLWIITHQVFYEAYPPDIKRIPLSVRKKIQGKVQIWRSNIYFFQIELKKSIVPLFHVILTEKLFFGIILMIKLIFKVKRSISRSNCWKCHF